MGFLLAEPLGLYSFSSFHCFLNWSLKLCHLWITSFLGHFPDRKNLLANCYWNKLNIILPRPIITASHAATFCLGPLFSTGIIMLHKHSCLPTSSIKVSVISSVVRSEAIKLAGLPLFFPWLLFWLLSPLRLLGRLSFIGLFVKSFSGELLSTGAKKI